MEPPRPASCQKVPLQSEDPPPSRMEVIQHLVRKASFSRRVAKVVAKDFRGSTAALYQHKWSRFLHWCCGQNISPCKATAQQIVEFFPYLQVELKLSASVVKSYCTALNHISSLAGVDLAANPIISRMFHSFERSCSSCEVKPPDWTLSLVLWSLMSPLSCPLIAPDLENALSSCSHIGQGG